MNAHITSIEREWLAVAPEGGEHNLVVRVSNLSLQPSGDWTADVSLGGLENRSYTIHGVDSWQAMHEAMCFAARRVKHFQEKGWSFHYERGDEPSSASDLFHGE